MTPLVVYLVKEFLT